MIFADDLTLRDPTDDELIEIAGDERVVQFNTIRSAVIEKAKETCPRNISREDLIAGLKAGRVAVVDRKDAPELQDLIELERQGLVESEFVEFDEQSTAYKFRWKLS